MNIPSLSYRRLTHRFDFDLANQTGFASGPVVKEEVPPSCHLLNAAKPTPDQYRAILRNTVCVSPNDVLRNSIMTSLSIIHE